MKTTIEFPDELYWRAKSEAALSGRKLPNLVEEGLRLVLEAPRKTPRRPSLAGLAKRARGMIDSGGPDLASNPKHLDGFGGQRALTPLMGSGRGLWGTDSARRLRKLSDEWSR
jgi:hypothetical protein